MHKVFEAELNQGEATETVCRECGKTFMAHTLNVGGLILPAPTLCSTDCSDAYTQREINAEWKKKWRRVIAGKYPDLLATDPDHPNMPPPEVQAKVIQWTYGPRGLMLLGPTGTGKTRTLFLLIDRLWGEGIPVTWLMPGDIGKTMRQSWNENDYDGMIERLSDAPILAIDDLGKEKVTERLAEMVFDVVNNRILRHRPMLITTNFVGEALIERFADKETARPLVRRIRENCESVVFAAKKTGKQNG